MIDSLAVVEDGATISSSATIGAFSYIGSGVVIADGVTVSPHARIVGDVTIASGTEIYSHATIDGYSSSITIGTDSHIREFAIIGSDSKCGDITIGNRCFIMGHVVIECGTTLADDVILTNSVEVGRGCHIGDRAIIGGQTTIGDGISIGSGAMVGGASIVKSHIPPYTLTAGYPKATIRGLNLIGLRRNIKNRDTITHIKRAFKELSKADYSSEIAEQILISTDDKYARELVEFVVNYQIG